MPALARFFKMIYRSPSLKLHIKHSFSAENLDRIYVFHEFIHEQTKSMVNDVFTFLFIFFNLKCMSMYN